MEIREACYVEDAEYIRQVRAETLKALNAAPSPHSVEPVPIAKYLVAYDDTNRPIGLAESAMLGDIYDHYEDSPNHAIGDLSTYCSIDEMATIRTVYADPSLRGSSSLFLSLTLASAKLFYGLGARYATATTGVSARGLRKLYLKYGGDIAGEGLIGNIETTLFVFELKYLLSLRALKRVSPYFAFDIPQPSKMSSSVDLPLNRKMISASAK